MQGVTKRPILRWAITAGVFVVTLFVAALVTVLADVAWIDPPRIDDGPVFCGSGAAGLYGTRSTSLLACVVCSIGIASYSSYRFHRRLHRRQAQQS